MKDREPSMDLRVPRTVGRRGVIRTDLLNTVKESDAMGRRGAISEIPMTLLKLMELSTVLKTPEIASTDAI